MLARVLRRGIWQARGKINEEAFVDKKVEHNLVSGDYPPSVFTRVRKYPDHYLPYNYYVSDIPLMLLVVTMVGMDYLLEQQLKAVTHRDDLSHRAFYSP